MTTTIVDLGERLRAARIALERAEVVEAEAREAAVAVRELFSTGQASRSEHMKIQNRYARTIEELENRRAALRLTEREHVQQTEARAAAERRAALERDRAARAEAAAFEQRAAVALAGIIDALARLAGEQADIDRTSPVNAPNTLAGRRRAIEDARDALASLARRYPRAVTRIITQPASEGARNAD